MQHGMFFSNPVAHAFVKMFDHHLAIATAKAAMLKRPPPSTSRSSSIIIPEPKKAARLAPPSTVPAPSTPASSSNAVKIPQFEVQELKWIDDGDFEDPEKSTIELRSQVLAAANECMAKQNAPTTISSYESVLNSVVMGAQTKLQTSLLPRTPRTS